MKQTCSNCGSDDIVNIQGQNFCINCGHQLAQKPQAVKALQKDKAVKVAPRGTKPKARGKISPPIKATASPVNPVPVVVNKPVTSVVRARKAVKESSEPPRAVNAQVQLGSPTQPRRVINPLGTQESSLEKPTKPTKAKQKPAVNEGSAETLPKGLPEDRNQRYLQNALAGHREAKAKAEKAEPTQTVQAETKPIQKEDIRPHPIGMSLRVGSVVGLAFSLAVAAGLWFQVDYDIMLFIVGTGVVVTILALTLAQAAMIYGLSRVQDHRPSPKSQWWSAARAGLLDTLNVDLTTIITLLIIAGGSVGAWQGVQMLDSSQVITVGLLVLANSLLAWLALGAVAARHIAIPAVIIGGLSSTAATGLGWRLYMKAGGYLALALIETWILRLASMLLVGVGALYLSRYLGTLSQELIIALVAGGLLLGIIVLFVLALQLEARVWLRQYRYWVGLYFPGRRLRLLTGRLQAVVRR